MYTPEQRILNALTSGWGIYDLKPGYEGSRASGWFSPGDSDDWIAHEVDFGKDWIERLLNLAGVANYKVTYKPTPFTFDDKMRR